MVIEPKIVGSKAFCSTTSLPEIYKKQNKNAFICLFTVKYSLFFTPYIFFFVLPGKPNQKL